MREILFRGKRSDTGEWIYGDLRQDKDLETAYIGGWDYFTADYALQREPFEYPISPETVGQYTGLTDKNGNRIFDGDVLKMEIKSNYINPLQAPLVFIGVCKFKDGAFGFSKQRAGIEEFTAFSSTTYNVEFEIIGNIHDNADLLGENNAKEQ